MQLIIAAVGKIKPSAEKDLFDAYCKRLPWEIAVREVQDNKSSSATVDTRKEREADLLLGAVKECEKIIALDERGKEFSSTTFSKQITDWQDTGTRKIGFVIGGADGHGKQIRQQADVTLCLGKLTWPHMLVRAMLAEQLYRAYSIQNNHPYHRA